MSETKRVLNFTVGSSEQLIDLVKRVSKLDMDLDLESTPSNVTISLYGTENEVEEASEKIRKIYEESRPSD